MTRFLHPDELKAFFTALSAEIPLFRDFFAVCLLTGARKSNVLSMRWTDLDLHAGYWRIPETKNNTVVVVPLVAPAVAILQARKEAADGSPWVFPRTSARNASKNAPRVLGNELSSVPGWSIFVRMTYVGV